MRTATAPHIVVVGGGLAGMAAALRCADRGAQVTLIEARPRLGGETWSFERRGLWFDNGHHVFLRCCTAYRAFLDRIGSTGDTFLQERLDIPVVEPGGRIHRLRRGSLPAPVHLAASLARFGPLGWRDRISAARGMLALRRLDRAALADQQTFGDWLRSNGQSEAAVSTLWDLIALPTLNLPAARASLDLGAMVFQTALLTDAAAADLGWALVPLARLHGDAGQRALTEAGAEVRMRATVEQVSADASVLVDGERLHPDGVVVAVPHQRVASLLTDDLLDADRVRALATSPIVNVNVVYDRPVTPLPLAAGVQSPVQWVFDRTEAAGAAGTGQQVLAVSLSAADDHLGQPPEVLVERFLPALEALFPDAAAATVVDAFATRSPSATFRASPGCGANRAVTRTASSRLTLAGAWTATGWPATMEGAVRSGVSAGDVLLTSLGAGRTHVGEVAP